MKIGYYAQEHETLDNDRTILENMRRPRRTWTCRGAQDPGFLPVHRRRRGQAGRVLSGGEKTRLALATLVVSSANVLLRRAHQQPGPGQPGGDPGRAADLHRRRGAGHHDEGAVLALEPERIILLPDGVEDLWNESYGDLVSLA
ncbi:hypothetical protein GXW82_42235 [Streptacidiphilus sp. 4-A2]|nr:hypothetical protein [Streptacidiphilus sp. 4-A2]